MNNAIDNLFTILNGRGNISTLFQYLSEVDKYDITVTAAPPSRHPRLEIDLGDVYWSEEFNCYCFYPIDEIALLPEEMRDVLLLLDTVNKVKSITYDELKEMSKQWS